MSQQLEVRSFRSVFALERRVYRIDTLRLNPGGVPLRGIAYALVLVAAAVIAGALPPTSWILAAVPWYARDLAAPLAVAALLGALRIEGRPFHLAAAGILRLLLGPRRLGRLAALPPGGRRWRPPPILLIPDGSDARFRALRYRGPGAVLVRPAHMRAEWGALARADVTLHPIAGQSARATVLELGARSVLEVRTR